MDRLISCEFNMDTACVELKFLDGSMIAIDTIAVENEVADNMYHVADHAILERIFRRRQTVAVAFVCADLLEAAIAAFDSISFDIRNGLILGGYLGRI